MQSRAGVHSPDTADSIHPILIEPVTEILRQFGRIEGALCRGQLHSFQAGRSRWKDRLVVLCNRLSPLVMLPDCRRLCPIESSGSRRTEEKIAGMRLNLRGTTSARNGAGSRNPAISFLPFPGPFRSTWQCFRLTRHDNVLPRKSGGATAARNPASSRLPEIKVPAHVPCLRLTLPCCSYLPWLVRPSPVSL